MIAKNSASVKAQLVKKSDTSDDIVKLAIGVDNKDLMHWRSQAKTQEKYKSNYDSILANMAYPISGEQAAEIFLNGAKPSATSRKMANSDGGVFYPAKFNQNLSADNLVGVPGQIRLHKPISIGKKKAKYFTPKGIKGCNYFMPEPPILQAMELFESWGLGVTLKELGELGYWGVVEKYPQIPLAITEGLKKAASIMAWGIPAIAAPGITQIVTKMSNFPLPELCGKGRNYILVPDQDLPQTTRAIVDSQINKLVSNLELIHYHSHQDIGSIIRLAWDGEVGKGFDDLVEAIGVEQLESNLQVTKLGKQRTDSGLIADVFFQIPKGKYLADMVTLPESTEHPVIGLKVPKGGGKTYAVAQHLNRPSNADKPKIGLTHRRKLTKQVGHVVGIPVLEDLKTGAEVRDLALVINSFKPGGKLNKKVSEFTGGTLFIDEADQQMRDLLLSPLMEKDRHLIITYLADVMSYMVNTGGQIILCSADLDMATVEFFSSLINHPANPYIIEATVNKPNFNYHLAEYRQVGELVNLLEIPASVLAKGGRVLIHTTSQKPSSKLAGVNIIPLMPVEEGDAILFDSQTTSQVGHEAHKELDNNFSGIKDKQLVVASPVLETGVSLELERVGKFDLVVVLDNSMHMPDAVRQMSARYRDFTAPRLFICYSAPNLRGMPYGGATDARQIIHKMEYKGELMYRNFGATKKDHEAVKNQVDLRPLSHVSTWLGEHNNYRQVNLLHFTAHLLADANFQRKTHIDRLKEGLGLEGCRALSLEEFEKKFKASLDQRYELNSYTYKAIVDDSKSDEIDSILCANVPEGEELIKLRSKRENLNSEEQYAKKKDYIETVLCLKLRREDREIVRNFDKIYEYSLLYYLLTRKPELLNMSVRYRIRNLAYSNNTISTHDALTKTSIFSKAKQMKDTIENTTQQDIDNLPALILDGEYNLLTGKKLNKKDAHLVTKLKWVRSLVNFRDEAKRKEPYMTFDKALCFAHGLLEGITNKYSDEYPNIESILKEIIYFPSEADYKANGFNTAYLKQAILNSLSRISVPLYPDADKFKPWVTFFSVDELIDRWAARDEEKRIALEGKENLAILKYKLTELATSEVSKETFDGLFKAYKSNTQFEEALATLPYYIRASLLNQAQRLDLTEPNIVMVNEETQEAFKAELEANDEVGLDLETWGDDRLLPQLPYPHKFKGQKSGGLDHIVGAIKYMQVYTPSNNTTYVVDFGGREGSVPTTTGKLLQDIYPILKDKLLVGHNLHFDLRFMRQQLGWKFTRFADTLIMMQTLFNIYNGQTVFGKAGYGLGSLSKEFLNLDIDKGLQVSDWGGQIFTAQINYAAIDPWVTYKLYQRLKYVYNKPKAFGITQVKPKHAQYQLECDTVLALVETEFNGMPFRMELAKKFIDEAERQLTEVHAKIVDNTGLQPSQSTKLKEFINEKYGLELKSLGKDIKKKYAKLAKKHDDGTYEEFAWLKQYTSLKNLLDHVYKAYNSAVINSGRVKTQIRVLSGTGRTASGNSKAAAMPNIQSVPKGGIKVDGKLTTIRELYGFDASENQMIIVSDLPASHNRIGAVLAKDEKASKILRDNLDGHTIKALSILKCLEDNGYSVVSSDPELADVVKNEDSWFDPVANKRHKELVSKATLSGGKGHRDVAKTISYGALNGSGAGKAAEIVRGYYGLELKPSDAKQILDAYWAATSDIQQYIKDQIKAVETNTFMVNDRKFGIYYHGWQGHYMCFPVSKRGRVQPTKITASLWSRPESTVIKRAMVRLQNEISQGLLPGAEIVNIVHDELDVICPVDQVHKVSLRVNELMQEEMSNMLGGFVPPDTKTAKEIADKGSSTGLTWAEK